VACGHRLISGCPHNTGSSTVAALVCSPARPPLPARSRSTAGVLGRALRKKQLGCGFDLQRVGNPRCRCPIKLSGLMGLTGDLPAGKLTL
jgi:hypothetical protein